MMKSLLVICIAVLVMFMASAAPGVLAMPAATVTYPRFKLIDMGTFGGPNSWVNGPQLSDLSNNGDYGSEADTNIPYPYPGYCPIDCYVEHAQALRNGVIMDLGTFPGVNLTSGIVGVAPNGLMTGFSETGKRDPSGFPLSHAVLYNKDGTITDLGTIDGGDWSFAFTINSQGLVGGEATSTIPDPFSMMFGLPYQTRGFVYQNGVMRDIGTLGGGDTLIYQANEQGQVAGISYTNATPNPVWGIPTQHAFLWQAGKMIDLGTLGGNIVLYDWINNLGQVAGTSTLPGDQTWHPFLWDHGTLKDLGTLGGKRGEAEWISDSGLVVGRADLTPASNIHHAFLWKNGTMTDLGVISPWTCSTALSVNSRGQVVGETGICGVGGGPAFFSQGGQPIVDINTLLLPGSNTNNITVVTAYQINESGVIAGGGVLPNGDFHAVVLVPASQAEIAAANALASTSQPHRYLPSNGLIESRSMLYTPRNRMLARFFRMQRLP